jgi:hypothetical protein
MVLADADKRQTCDTTTAATCWTVIIFAREIWAPCAQAVDRRDTAWTTMQSPLFCSLPPSSPCDDFSVFLVDTPLLIFSVCHALLRSAYQSRPGRPDTFDSEAKGALRASAWPTNAKKWGF